MDDRKRIFLTSNSLTEHPLLKNRYRVLMSSNFDSKVINRYLKDHDFGKVILRASIEPENYWDIRKRLEEKLSGDKKAHLFLKKDIAILCEVL